MVTDQDYRVELRELSQSGDGALKQHEALRNGYAYVDLSRISVDQETLGLVSAETARNLKVLPVKKDGPNVWVCMEMPPAPRDMHRLAVETNCRVIPVSVIDKALVVSLEFYYPDVMKTPGG